MADGSLELTEVADCQIIAKHFERGAAYSTTEESVFALMTPLLTTSRIQSKGISNQIQSREALTSLQSSQQKIQTSPDTLGVTTSGAVNLQNLDKADEKDEGMFTTIRGNFFPGRNGEVEPIAPVTAAGTPRATASIFGNIFNSKCIPCGDRLNMSGELSFKAEVLSPYFKYWRAWLQQHIQMLQDMLKMFNDTNGYVDLCALIKFLKEFICVPDLARMLSALMALLSRVNFDISGVFDLILQIVAPLLQPFLSNFVDMLQRYILLIIKPIECIINAIQNILTKLDYNVLFKNIGQLDKSFEGIGRKGGKKSGEVKYTAGVLEFFGADKELHEGPRTGRIFGIDTGIGPASFNPLESASKGLSVVSGGYIPSIKQQNENDQRGVEEARAELEAVRASSAQVDVTSPTSVERYNDQLKAAQEKLKDAEDKRDLSAIGRINKTLSEFTNKFRSSLMMLIGMLREAARVVEAFFKELFDELKKLMGEYFGGGGSMIQILASKLAIIQMISLISQLIKLFSGNLHCDDDEKDIKVERFIPQNSNMKVWTDENGDLHIEEDPEVIRRAVDSTVKAVGTKPFGSGSPGETGIADKGQSPTEQTPRQKLESLIEFTGDPVLDSSIARMTEALTTPVNVVFKCPLQTSVQDAEQVNTWIKELNTA